VRIVVHAKDSSSGSARFGMTIELRTIYG
jgi:hypothetical protein